MKEGDCVYFVHSFYADNCPDSVTATTEYGIDLTASVRGKHLRLPVSPEKSGKDRPRHSAGLLRTGG